MEVSLPDGSEGEDMADKSGTEDKGTRLAPDQAALVVNADGSCELILPNLGEEQTVPEGQMLIYALAYKLDRPGWRDELVREFIEFAETNREAIESGRDGK